MVIATAQGEVLLDPDNLGPSLQPASRQIDDFAVQRSVPDISDIASKKCVGFPPVGAVVVEHLALRQLARVSNRAFGYFRGAVGIGQTARSQTGQDVFKSVRFEADQVKVETAKFEITQLTAEQIRVPARPRRKFIVGQAIGLLLLFAPPARNADATARSPTRVIDAIRRIW